MKILDSDKAAFIWRLMLVFILFSSVITACAFGALAVSSADDFGRYMPHTTESTLFRVFYLISLSMAIVLPFTCLKGSSCVADSSSVEGQASVSEEPSMALISRIASLASRFSFVLPAALSLYVAYFALADESLGTWGNAFLIASFVSALFFLFKTLREMRVIKALCGFGVFALGALVIASLYLDHVIEINSDFKLMVQFAAAGIILGTIADIRLLLSRTSRRWYILLKLVGFILCSICSAVIIPLMLKDGDALPASYLTYSWLYLAHALSTLFDILAWLFDGEQRHI